MKYSKYEYDSYTVHVINTNKFKSTLVSLILINDFNKENITKNALLRKLLTYSSKSLKNEQEVAKKVYELYNSGIVVSNDVLNNIMITDFSIEILQDKYTEKGLLENALQYYFDTIFNPNIENGKFEEVNFNLAKKALYDYYDRKKENKDKYALDKAYEMLDLENLKYNLGGYREDLDKLNPKKMADYYYDIFKKANANIFIIGNIDEDKILKIINNNVKGKFYKNKNIYKANIFNEKSNIKEGCDTENNNQSKLVMIYKIINMSRREKNVVLPLFNRILGVGNNSKLFRKVREEKSLAYDIRSMASMESLVTVLAGISYDSKDEVISCINEEIDKIKSGLITNKDLEDAKKFRLKILRQFEDENDSILYTKINSILFDSDDLDERFKAIETVKLNEIIDLAQKLELNIIYTLKGECENEQN